MNKTAHYIDLAAKAYGRENKEAWRKAFCAYRVVGRYDGSTAELAARCGREVDSIEKWASAYRVFLRIRHVSGLVGAEYGRIGVRELRGKLTVSHFAKAGQLIERFGLPGEMAANILADCVLRDGKTLSVQAMERAFLADMQAEQVPVNWRKFYLPKFLDAARAMLTFPDLDPEWKDAALYAVTQAQAQKI